GIYDYQIWRHGDLVVSRMRTRHGYDQASAVTGASAVQTRWTESMSHIFAEIADADGAPLWLEEVFRHRVPPAGEAS
ncbi:MAG: L-rhamnose mutarotase, partial [Rhizobiaceae bacterium]|nr:L-rhamnose mutarotase [Rhizobiaceae bacterium]